MLNFNLFTVLLDVSNIKTPNILYNLKMRNTHLVFWRNKMKKWLFITLFEIKMRRTVLIILLLSLGYASKAQDSCYVYTQLHWAPAITKYIAKIQLSDKGNDMDITDENGNKLLFYNMIHALNYLSSKGWSLVQLGPLNPENSPGANREQYALIRKWMSLEESKKYSTPKKK